MDIQINNEYWLGSDEYQYILRRKIVVQEGKTKGKVKNKNVAYCSTLESVIRKWADADLRACEASSFSEVIERIQEQNEIIGRLLPTCTIPEAYPLHTSH